jgi:hypothetical protein
MKISQIFTQGGSYGWHGCGNGCDHHYNCDEWGCYDCAGGYHWRHHHDCGCNAHDRDY